MGKKVWVLVVSGPLAPYAAGFESWLRSRAYSPSAAAGRLRQRPGRSVTGARDLVCALRSLLRYLHLAGLIQVPLAWAVPSVADLRDRTLPHGLDPGAVKRLLASCDRRTLAGRRDYAISQPPAGRPPGAAPAHPPALPAPVAAELISALAAVALAGTVTGPARNRSRSKETRCSPTPRRRR